MNEHKNKLKDIIVSAGLVTEEQLAKALSLKEEEGKRLSDVLVQLGFVEEKALLACISEHFNVIPMSISKFSPDPELLKLVPKSLAQHYLLVPISKLGKRLTVAMSDPLNIFAIDDIKSLTELEIKAVLSSESEIIAAIQRFYAPTGAMEDVLKSFQGEVEIEEEEEEEEISQEKLFSETEDSPVIKVVNFVLVESVKEQASDIHIEPGEKEVRIRFRIDGVLYDMDTNPPKYMQQAICSRIKIMANLNIAERRLPQDGRIRIKLDGRDIDFRVSVLPTYYGEKIVLRLLDKSNLFLNIDDLGFAESSVKAIRRSIKNPHGIMLVTGPTGSGKTSTLYSCLNEVNDPKVNIVTVEDPVEYQLEGINQVPVRADIGFTFAAALRSILRQDPDIVMIGEVRDKETADIAIKAALTGHLVFSTLHTNDAPGTISRLDDMGVEPFLISSSVIMIAAQRLLRRVCPHCSKEYEVSRESLERVGVKLEDNNLTYNLIKGEGCEICKGTGFKGRFALLEVLEINDELRSLIIERADSSRIKKAAVNNGMETLRQLGLRKVMEKVTTLDEVLRVTSDD